MNLDRLLVKAKRVDNGKWVVGHYNKGMHGDIIMPIMQPVVTHDDGKVERQVVDVHLVDLDTICQCSAKTDYVDAFIFDNDMLYKDGKYFGYARFNEKYLKWEIVLANNKHGKTTALATHCKELTVIGNIHDSKGE